MTEDFLDTLSRAQRSERMARVRAKDSHAEKRVRSIVHVMGYRFRLHGAKLPGKPDLVFASRQKVIFVHGCFWHRHPDPNCRLARLPKSRQDFWIPKLEGNRERDLRNEAALAALGWRMLTIWECQLRDEAFIRNEIGTFLES
jgi:DNA mismatch endonuclease (patch repair protein)